jgi:hypothetical protein
MRRWIEGISQVIKLGQKTRGKVFPTEGVLLQIFFWIIDESIKIVDESHPEARKLGKSVPCYERISARKGGAFEMEQRKEVGQKRPVSELCLGTMPFGWSADEKEAFDI